MKILNKKFCCIILTILLLNLCLPVVAFGVLSAPLKPGHHTLWIDRLDLSSAIDDEGLNYAENFYLTLSAATQPESDTPYLVDLNSAPHYVDEDNDYYYIPIATFYGPREEMLDIFTTAHVYTRAVYEAFERDHPEVCWLNRTTKIIMTGTNNPNMSELRLVLWERTFYGDEQDPFSILQTSYPTTESILAAIAERETCIQKILETVTGATRYEKIRQINKWLTEHNRYSTQAPESLAPDNFVPHDCLGALRGSSGDDGPMCEGFSRAFKVLCDRLDIPCVLVSGIATADNDVPSNHMWNMVQMEDGNWYGVDATWNLSEETNLDDPASNMANEEYLLVGSNTLIFDAPFWQSHVICNEVSAGPVVTPFINGPQLSPERYSPDEDGEPICYNC